MPEVKKTIVIGLDAPIVKSIKKYAEEGKLPNIKKLITNGTWAQNCLVPFPTITPPNWTTIATGAWPGTHNITCFHYYKKGDPLNETYQAFLSSDVKAEYIWEAAEKVNRKSIVLNYPTTWPPRMKLGIQIGGAGLSVNDWRIKENGNPCYHWQFLYTVCADQLVSTEEYPASKPVKIEKAKNWENIDLNTDPLEVEINFEFRNSREEIKEKKTYYLLIIKDNEKYKKIYLCKNKDLKSSIACLEINQWSEKIFEEIETKNGKRKGVFKVKLLDLSEDGKKLKLYISPICQLDGWAFPQEIAKELEKLDNFPIPITTSWISYNMGWIDFDTLSEIFEIEHSWLADVACHLFQRYDWSLFFMQAHCPDFMYHSFINKLEPSVCRDKDEIERYTSYELRFYESLDRMIGKIIQNADKNTLVIITSDHGAVPTERYFEKDRKLFYAQKVLDDAGLTVYKQEGEQKVIDWSKTKAICQRSVYIYVNLKGRDPHGIVEPEEYDKVRDQIINLLYDYIDPETGKKPVAFALKKEDARIIGLYGEEVGDIVYSIRPEAGHEHGRQLPTAEYGIGSMKGLLIMSGPNIKKDFKLERTVWLTDIVPTICYLMDLPVPRDCEGSIIYQALEDPNYKIKEIETLKKNYERLQKAFDATKAQTHSY